MNTTKITKASEIKKAFNDAKTLDRFEVMLKPVQDKVWFRKAGEFCEADESCVNTEVMAAIVKREPLVLALNEHQATRGDGAWLFRNVNGIDETLLTPDYIEWMRPLPGPVRVDVNSLRIFKAMAGPLGYDLEE